MKRKLAQTKPSIGDSTDAANGDTVAKKSTDDYEYDGPAKENNKISRKRSNSLTGSTASSTDDSGNSITDELSSSSGTSSPASSAAHDEIRFNHHNYEEEADCGRGASPVEQSRFVHMSHQPFPNKLSPGWIDLMTLRYLSSSAPYQPSPFYYPPFEATFNRMPTELSPLKLHYATIDQPFAMPHKQLAEFSPRSSPISNPTKKCGFTISAILGCES